MSTARTQTTRGLSPSTSPSQSAAQPLHTLNAPHSFTCATSKLLIKPIELHLINTSHLSAASSGEPPGDALTLRQAATLLNVSGAFIADRLASGALAAAVVGSTAYIPIQSLLEYKAQDDAQRLATLAQHIATSQDLGLDD